LRSAIVKRKVEKFFARLKKRTAVCRIQKRHRKEQSGFDFPCVRLLRLVILEHAVLGQT
jgi:hypothetical protein